MLPRVFLLLIVLSVIACGIRQLYLALWSFPALRPDEMEGAEPALPRDDEELASGAFLHRILTEGFCHEREAWALEQARSVADRLQPDRPPEARLHVEVLWTAEVNAFTAPGRWVYLSRRLMERCMYEDAVAMVVAHEIAHHDLGHLDGASPLVWMARQRLHGPEHEAKADAHGFNLCLAAGYDPWRALHLFDVLEAHALDVGARSAVFGPESAIDAALADAPEWKVELLRWLHARRTGYLPLRERKAALANAYLAAAAECT
ncbi:MAG TPA: M48 family metallopeptidase [Longimicrobium sp.]|jgi:predicted Zn-dependent protease